MRGVLARVRSFWHGLRKPARFAAVVCTIAAAFMVAVTALACVAPARRALRIQPIDTLKTT